MNLSWRNIDWRFFMNLSWKNIDGVYCLVFSAKATGDIDSDENVYFSYVFTEFVHYFQTKGNLELAGKFLKLVDLFVNAKPNDDEATHFDPNPPKIKTS